MFQQLKINIKKDEEELKMKELKNEVNEQKNKLKIFLNLEENYKIGKYKNGIYYIVYPNWFQQTWRWMYNENRGNTFTYLDTDFTIFCKLLDKLTYNLQHGSNYNFYVIMINEIIKFIDDMLPGLYSLKQTYNDTPKLIAKVDSIILVLIDFKDKSNEIKLCKNRRNIYKVIRNRSNSGE